MQSWLRKLYWLWRRRRTREEELREELRFHLEEETQQRLNEGWREGEARRAARREFGNVTSVQEATRSAWTWRWLEELAQDLRYAGRAMGRNRLFTALAVMSLSLGIGANTAIYSLLDAVLMRRLPVADADSLALLNWHSLTPRGPKPNHVARSMDGETWADGNGTSSGIFPYGAFEMLRDSAPVFSTVFAYYPAERRTVSVEGQAETARGEYVSGGYFGGLAVRAAAGRLIAEEDDRAGAPLVAVLSMRAAQRHFGDAARAVGQSVRIDNVAVAVIGVAPAEFFGVDPEAAPDFYVPLHSNLVLDGSESWAKQPQAYLNRNYYWVELMGRLRPGVSREQAEAALAPRFHQWVEATASNERERESLPALTVKEGGAGLGTLRRRYAQPLYVLWGMVALILAIACANTANLLLSRAAARRREMAVRLSIGAGRWRLMRQLLTESVLLAVAGGAVGLALGAWGVRALTVLLANGSEDFPLRASLNPGVLAATFGLSVLCGMVFGLAPAMQATRADVAPTLSGGRGAEPRAQFRVGGWRVSLTQALVVAQIVFSLVMLVGATLFVRTLANLQSIPMGFKRENVLLFEVNARQAGHAEPEIFAFYENLRTRLRSIPGAQAVTLSHASLLHAGRRLDLRVQGVKAPETWILNTGPRFFTTMQIPLLRGREIDEHDLPGSPGVVVANERFAKIHFGDANPLGRRLTLGGPHPREMEIVGIAANAHYGRLKDETPPVVYIPYNQGDYPKVQQMVYALRTTGDPAAYAKSVQEAVRQADSRIPVTHVVTQAVEIERSMNQEIVFARLCTGFAVLALAIACVGMYGTMAYAVAQRGKEIGIRMALGAQRSVVVRMILGQVVALAGAGLAIAAPLAAGTSRWIESFLFGIRGSDPRAIGTAAAILLAAALLAGFLPALRASRIEPVRALRDE